MEFNLEKELKGRKWEITDRWDLTLKSETKVRTWSFRPHKFLREAELRVESNHISRGANKNEVCQ